MARGMDSEAGGAADLQTDVMRFMAILSLCLMVIFALVQSVPVETPPMPTPVPVPAVKQVPVDDLVEPPPPVEVMRVEPERPIPVPQIPVKPEPKPEPEPAPSSPQETEVGFTLRFENDLALTRLVARDEIGLYAISADGAMRMTINRDKAEFWSASVPKQYHEMDTATVPQAVIRAFNTSSASGSSSIKWGVTLPAVMSGKLNTYMQEYRGGSLVISANGILTMESQ